MGEEWESKVKRPRSASFAVVGVLDGAGGVQRGTVVVERAAGLVHVRPHRRRRVYTMPLSMVADMICKRILFNEAAERRAAKSRSRSRSGKTNRNRR